MKPLLFVNRSIFSTGGVLGRLDYLVALLKLIGWFFIGALASFIFTFLLQKIDPAFKRLLVVYAIVGGGILLYYKYVNAFKRIRDIRGITLNQIYWQAGYVILSIIPGLGFLVSLSLFFIPGVISPNENKVTKSDLQQV